jgi:hypothetical protein
MERLKRNLFVVVLFAATVLHATDSGESTIVAKNRVNGELVNSSGPVDIVNPSAYTRNGLQVCNFRIKSLPSSEAGTLYMADGTTEVVVDANLTKKEVRALTFDPKDTFVGDATFTYTAMDLNGNEGNIAKVTLPITAPVVEETPETTVGVTTDDKQNPEMLNTLSAVNILNLSGKDANGVAVNSFIIKSLPNAEAGVLYMADGTTAVVVDQTLTKDEADALMFDPKESFVGDGLFTYQAVDANGALGNVATVTLPIIGSSDGAGAGVPDGNGGDASCVCEDYNESIPSLSGVGMAMVIFFTTLFGLFLGRKELV